MASRKKTSSDTLTELSGDFADARVQQGMTPQEAVELVRKRLEKRARDRLDEIQGHWHNARWGRIVLGLLLVGLLTVVAITYRQCDDAAFTSIARGFSIIASVTVGILLVREDPFHEDLPGSAALLERIKGSGKVVSILLITGGVATALDLVASNREQDREHHEIISSISVAAEEPIKKLGELRGDLATTRSALGELDQRLAAATGKIDALKAKIAALEVAVGNGWLGTITSITQNMVTQSDVETKLLTRSNLDKTLAESSWGKKVVKSDDPWVQKVITEDSLVPTLKDSDWGKALVTTSNLASTLRDSEWGKKLATADGVDSALKNVPTAGGVVSALVASEWGQKVLTTSNFQRALEQAYPSALAASKSSAGDATGQRANAKQADQEASKAAPPPADAAMDPAVDAFEDGKR